MFSPHDIRWTPGAVELIRTLNASCVRVLVATNQSGVARGFFNEQQLLVFHEVMREQLSTMGAQIDGIEYCPHHPTEGLGHYRVDCACRKPKGGMLEKLMLTHGLSTAATLMIGDREVDMAAARAAQVEGLLFAGGNLMDAFMAAGYGQRLPGSTGAPLHPSQWR